MKKILLSILLIMMVSACSSEEAEMDMSNGDDQSDKAAELPEVELEFAHEPLPVNKETAIKATVTQGGEPVSDATYVKFEIWNSEEGQDASETVEVKHSGNGVYELKHTFETEGNYQVIAHTQVDDLHTMPQKEVSVGQSGEASGHDHSNNSGKFMVHLRTEETFKAGVESTLTSHINHMEEPFSEGLVRFEISSDQMENHVFIDAEEKELGEYTAPYTFPSPGTYTVNIHLEKQDEEVHEHKEETIQVVE